MIERGISTHEVEDALKKGSKEFQEPNKILHHFSYFTVVAKKIKESYYVITVKPRW